MHEFDKKKIIKIIRLLVVPLSLFVKTALPPSLLLNLPVVSLSLSQNRFSFFSPFLPLSYQLAFSLS